MNLTYLLLTLFIEHTLFDRGINDVEHRLFFQRNLPRQRLESPASEKNVSMMDQS